MKLKLLSFMLMLGCAVGGLRGQSVALKTNLLSDAALTPTIGIETGLAPKWSVELTGMLNAWEVNNHIFKQWQLKPELRYWFCQRFSGHFVGAHLIAGQFNFGNIDNGIKFLGTDFSKLSDRRYQGWDFGAGLAYGYAWILSKHWSLEAEIGLGWIHARFDEFRCADCGKKLRTNLSHNYFGPTKAAINLVCTF
ncbi:MAG: DUF3575 domain-containing protein [Muribaculaceae bacterium]|nr:DUF3575 domain-containing protein [Muribaculaceae bacterium]